MPCMDQTTVSEWQQRALTLAARNDDLAQMLCAVCRKIDEKQLYRDIIQEVPGLPAWWMSHKEADRLRILGEKNQALGQLTRGLRQLLGLPERFE